MANLPPEALMAALQAVHKTGVATDPNAQMAGGAGASGTSSAQSSPQGGAQTQTADPNAAAQDSNADPNAQPGQDPAEQAVWSEFPATDPGNVEALAQQMQGAAPDQLVQLLGQFMQQADADNQKLSQMHEAMLEHLMQLLGGPGGDGGQGAGQAGPSAVGAGPGVGGQGSGY